MSTAAAAPTSAALIAALQVITNIPEQPANGEYDLDDLDEVIAGPYLRVSHDKKGRQRSPTEQLADAQAACDRKRRWRMSDVVFTDTASASKFARKRRADFDELLKRLVEDTYEPHVVMIWEVSRSTRKVEEMKTLLALARWRGRYVFVIDEGGRLCSPWSVSDWGWLMSAAVRAEQEAMQTSQRTRRSTRLAPVGTPNGGRAPFGYRWKRGTLKKDTEQAAIVVDLVARAIAGATVWSLAASLNKQKVKTAAGKAWQVQPLKNMLVAPRLAGLTPDGQPALWEPIITPAQHERVKAVLKHRGPALRGRHAWALTGLLSCERCGTRLVGHVTAGGVRRYVCKTKPGSKGCGGIGIKAEPLEALLGVLVTERLADADARRGHAAGPDDGPELAELAEIDAERAAVALNEEGLSRKAKAAEHAALDRREHDVEARLAAKARSAPVKLDLVAVDGFVGRRWDELSVERQRELLAALIVSVSVGPASRRGSREFEGERVTGTHPITGERRIVWRDS